MKDIGIDLGTANVLIYVKGEGIVLNEPSVLAIDTETKNILAVGREANEMLGRTPGKVNAIRPLKGGVIADFDYTQGMLSYFIKKVRGRAILSKPRIIICCPSNVTTVEKNAIKDAAERLGAKKVYVEEEPKVAAIGAGMDISKPSGNMIIDIGGGTTDIAILSLGSIVNSQSVKIAGDSFDKAIIDYIKSKHNLLIGEKSAENVKINIGNVYNSDKTKTMKIKGRDLIKGLPSTATITEKEIEEALHPLVIEIIKTVKTVLESAPPELSADIFDKGVVLTGGGALLNGISELFEKELSIPVLIAEDPLTCVAEGCGTMLSNLYLLD